MTDEFVGKDASLEQVIENYSRDIFNKRHQILEDFYKTYAAFLCLEKNEVISLDDICLIEQIGCFVEGKVVTKYWFDLRPRFQKEEI